MGLDFVHGLGTVSDINTHMKFLLPMARNSVTGQTVKTQDLNGYRFNPSQRDQAQAVADRLAQGLSDRTGEIWQGFVIEYTPSYRR